MNRKIVIIGGPTAVGKTEYSLEIAEKLSGEIVSADSMQLYKYMNIGSAKPTPDELQRVPHHLVDRIDPRESFSVAEYRVLAREAIFDIFERNRQPVISGGTGLYINSLIYDMDFSGAVKDESYRRELVEIAEKEGPEKLHEMLMAKDPEAARRIHHNNVQKMVRALETVKQTGSAAREFSRSFVPVDDYGSVILGLNRPREELYERINLRVDILVEKGLVEEVRSLMNMGLTENDISMKGIGYKEIIASLKGQCTLDEAIDTIKKNTRHYAKRQLTWLRRYENIKWFDLSGYDTKDSAVEDMLQWIKTNLQK